jgi:hypothetical protein
MPALLHSVRGTVQAVMGHLVWYVDWQTRGPRAARETAKA